MHIHVQNVGDVLQSVPANQTGKLLSPRKIMMDTRDRLTEVGKNIQNNKGVYVPDGKQLLNDYIFYRRNYGHAPLVMLVFKHVQ